MEEVQQKGGQLATAPAQVSLEAITAGKRIIVIHVTGLH